MSPSKRKFRWGIMRSTRIKRYIDLIYGCKIWRINRKCRIPIDLYPCKVKEGMTMNKVGDQTIGVIRRRRIDKEGNVSRFQEYHTSDEEEEEELSEHPPYNKYGFVDHPQLQMEDQRNEFPPYPLPPQEGNMNGWLTDDANDSDLGSTASNQPMSLTMKDTGASTRVKEGIYNYGVQHNYTCATTQIDLVMSPSKRKFHWGIMRSTGIRRYIDPISGCKIWRTNRKCHIPIDLYPCKVKERMTMKNVGDQTIGVIQRRRIDNEGNVSRFQEYHTSDEEEKELSEYPPYNKYGFVDHPRLQMEDQRNEFAPYPLPPQEGNMNGWLTGDANDSDLESTVSNQPMSLTMETLVGAEFDLDPTTRAIDLI
uniref:Uncharacterized protein n=1 Tax=Tanacetum cinerariifolium TaxID=118510 RepID=A0A6L2LAS7_TANCI|nr:hypothetical protein [Tanacetum cinerariifolium]